jgi:hypothetical protein
MRMAVRRVRLRSLARVGFSIGWIISLLPSLVLSACAAWALHGIWGTLDGWTPWTPWDPGTRVGPITLPTPEFRPREALRVEGLYQMLEPIGRRPVLGAILGTVALTAIGGGLVALTMILAGLGYNLFSRFTGGLEFEMVPRAPSPRRASRRPEDAAPRTRGDEWDDTDLQW